MFQYVEVFDQKTMQISILTVSMVKYVSLYPIIVDQEVGGSIPPNRTNLFNDLSVLRTMFVLYGVQMASNLDRNFSQRETMLSNGLYESNGVTLPLSYNLTPIDCRKNT
jgi:hypothetical protein